MNGSVKIYMFIKFAARSDKGNIRKNNEDNLFCNGVIMNPDSLDKPFYLSGVAETPCVFAICDGMGGEDCGEIASFTAIKTLTEHAEKIKSGTHESINNYVNDSAKCLRDIMREKNIRTGTTLALVVIKQDSFIACNLGDSRIYRISDGKLIRVTDDHTVAAEKMRMGLITPAKAEHSPERNILTRCLGIYDDETEISPDFYGSFEINNNDGILICSDGLTDMLSYKEIAEIITKYNEPDRIINNLVESALNNGGFDNITCIYLRSA